MLFARVQQEFDWDEYLRTNFETKTTPSDEIRIHCFACGDDKFKLYVNPVKRKWNCFKCGFKSGKCDTFDFVAKAEHIPRHKAIERIVREYARTTPDDLLEAVQTQQTEDSHTRSSQTIKKLSGLPKGATLLSSRTEESKKFWDYLISRGLTEREIIGVRAHYIAAQSCIVYDAKQRRRGDVGNRLLFPIYGGDNSLVSWQARVVDPDYQGHDKYLTAPESELTKTVWPYVKPHGNTAVLTEGILDALAVRRLPQVSAYSTFSKKISLEQMLLLKSWGVTEVTVFWDKRDALKEIVKAVPDLQMHFNKVYVCRMTNWPVEKDPGNMLAEIKGSDTIMEALNDRVDTYDSLEFARWQLAWTV